MSSNTISTTRNQTNNHHNKKKVAKQVLTIPIYIGKLFSKNGLDFPKDDGSVTVECCATQPNCIKVTIENKGQKTFSREIEGHLNKGWVGTFEGGDYVS